MKHRGKGDGSWSTITTAAGTSSLCYRKVYSGKRKAFYGKTKREVLQKVKDYEMKNAIAGDDVIQAMLFYTYCQKWLFEWRRNNIKSKTIDYYESIIDNYIYDTPLGSVRLKTLNDNAKNISVSLFEKHLLSFKDKYAKSTIDGIYTVLKQVCKYAYKKGDIAHNWMEDVEKLSAEEIKKKKKKTISLTYEQILKLQDEMMRKNKPGSYVSGSMDDYVYGVTAHILLFIAYTGCRLGEVLGLRWEDVDFEKKCFKIDKQLVAVKNRDEKTKNENRYVIEQVTPKSVESIRIIPLCDEAINILKLTWKRFGKGDRKYGLIFTATGNPVPRGNINRTLKAMCKRQELPIISPHELRHSFASVLLNQDKQNLYTVSNLLGHSSPDVTYKNYIDIFEEEKIKTIKIFDSLKSEKEMENQNKTSKKKNKKSQ